ncbi:relaxase/mobilization nuclease domain-containing protein [Mucilaginibacter ginsenosidivorax]|uniref:Relaxase/mobilization nuclease n=1 Tax=Mucilaginibacter ginsenosidivorax TaxID=862126 RepID=A0A5B8W467_9SPHI|nr:relaxase/mobilization nuclease domain-containing protein [Mucilaginibacter ginsenosidivorax]QEC78523.1 relaxase/mobilization nuclease [Mucilaginibacter ginsenosidivorax]
MVAKIKSGKSLIGALNYNEHKIEQGKATLLEASGYLKDHRDLSFYDKLYRLKDQAGKNQRVKTNTVHISLNFDPAENPDKEKLVAIADAYMKGIGFADQPYLIYQHTDAGHAHIHIVSTNIESNGDRISLHNLGRNQSERARQEIEERFGLVKASSKSKDLKPEKIMLNSVQYGKTETKRAITNIVNEVVRNYKFTSLPELNAVLNQFNITADRGTKASVINGKKGLNYYVLGSDGEKTGVPIKASTIYSKPTLRRLENSFVLNEALRRPFKDRFREKIDRACAVSGSSSAFQKQLVKAGMHAVIRQNEEGRIYGITFVDHQLKAVFNGSDLGKNYSAASVLNRLNISSGSEGPENMVPAISLSADNIQTTDNGSGLSTVTSLLEILFHTEQQEAGGPDQLMQKKKRKKRKRLNL